MRINFDSLKPIYIQVAEAIEDDIILGKLSEGEAVYSQLLLARELGINPATAAKGIHQLVQKGVLDKQRGLAMMVALGAKQRLLHEKRESEFSASAEFLVEQAIKIGISPQQVADTIQQLFVKYERSKQDE